MKIEREEKDIREREKESINVRAKKEVQREGIICGKNLSDVYEYVMALSGPDVLVISLR